MINTDEGSREQGAGSREQGAGSREQGAGSKIIKYYKINIYFTSSQLLKY
jgi:hypothetical protein